MEEVLHRVVRLHGVDVGRVVDVILERDGEKAMGFEVLCKDGVRRFLPAPAASPVEDGVVIDSPFSLLDGEQLDFYREQGVGLRTRQGNEPAA